MGESKEGVLRPDFDRRLKLKFHGSKVTSDAGLLPYRELDEAVGVTEIAGGRADGHPSWEERSPRSCRAVPPVRFRTPYEPFKALEVPGVHKAFARFIKRQGVYALVEWASFGDFHLEGITQRHFEDSEIAK